MWYLEHAAPGVSTRKLEAETAEHIEERGYASHRSTERERSAIQLEGQYQRIPVATHVYSCLVASPLHTSHPCSKADAELRSK
jgi:hypothetical protein